MGLADEIEQLADDAYHYNSTTADMERFRARLIAIEQELASLRMDALQAESQRLGLYSVGRIEGGALLRRQHEAGAECPQDRIVQPSDLDASHSFSALPCTSEYVNAQTGYDGEDGRDGELGDETGG